MTGPDEAPPSDLRTRKAQRVRAALIEAAAELCLQRGYENTTVEQIAEVADVSPRTFSRYFPTKESVFVAILDDIDTELVAELRVQPEHLGPLEALRSAQVALYTRLAERPLGGLSADRLLMIQRVLYRSKTLRQAAVEYRSDTRAQVLALRMGVTADDVMVEFVQRLFTLTAAIAWRDVDFGAGGDELRPEALIDRLTDAYTHLARYAADRDVPS